MGVVVREKVKGSGEWWVFVNHRGKRKARKVGAKTAANDVAKRIQKAMAAKAFKVDDEPAPTFGELAKDWISLTVPATCKASTLDDYRTILRKHVLPAFKGKPVDQITRLMVKDFLLGKVAKGYAPSTVTHMKNAVSGVLNRAVEAGIMEHNPAQSLGRLYRDKPRGRDITPLTMEELGDLLGVLQARWPTWYPFVLTLARTGMRAGEALGLKWEDIDFRQRLIHIRRSLSKMQMVTPKSGKTRAVDMTPQLAETLRQHRTMLKRIALEQWGGKVPDLVFVNREGRPVDINHFRGRTWKSALRAADLEHKRIHDLRHTYATLRIQAGHNIADVSKQLGHYSVKFTLDQYYHWLPGKAKSEVDELDRLQPSATYTQPAQKEGASHAG